MSGVIRRLSRVIVHVDDMELVTAFYRDVLGVQPSLEGPFWTTFDTGAVELALHGGGRVGAANVRVSFEVSDLDAARAALAARGVETSDVREPAPGIRVCDLRDPEGNGVALEELRAPAG